MFFFVCVAKTTLNMLCGSPEPVFAHTHKAKPLPLHKLRFFLVPDNSRTYGHFATANVINIVLGARYMVYTSAFRGILKAVFSEWIPFAEGHYSTPFTASILRRAYTVNHIFDNNYPSMLPLAKKLGGLAWTTRLSTKTNGGL